MNRTTEVLSQALENEGQNQKVTQQRTANGDGPRLVACVLLLPENAEVLAGLLRTLATNSHASHDIESRKFGGRLEYRLSSLDRFKEQHVRPARLLLRQEV